MIHFYYLYFFPPHSFFDGDEPEESKVKTEMRSKDEELENDESQR